MRLRTAEEGDHPALVDRIQRWWSESRSPEQARQLATLLPRLFLQHFAATSLVLEDDTGMRAFLVGFDSPGQPSQAYIHFVGVDPALRQGGIARRPAVLDRPWRR